MHALSLRTKLTLALLTVGIASAVLVGAVARIILLQRFDDIQLQESFGRFQNDVVQYVGKYETWDKAVEAESFLEFSRSLNAQRGPARGRRGGGGQGLNTQTPPFRFLLLEPETDRILLGADQLPDGRITPELRRAAMPIRVGGRLVAQAVPLRQPNFNAFDVGYVQAMQSAMLYGVGAASLLAIGLGLIIGARLSRRISSLTTAIAAMAQGDLYQRVDETAGDEVGTMARVFNQMSRELYESRERIEQQTIELRELSIRDPLTRLHNRRHFDEQAATAFAQARRYSRPLTAMMCDVDHFKKINDTYSHAVGDEVLKLVATILQANTRSSDIVARYGGEEFAVIFTESGPKETLALAERIRERIEAHPWEEVEHGLRVTISIGMDSDTTRASVGAMLAAADERLYEAKHYGRNRVVAEQV